jgi:hypothetical protein
VKENLTRAYSLFRKGNAFDKKIKQIVEEENLIKGDAKNQS